MRLQNILLRYGAATLGLLFVALGIALSILSNLGTAPLSCPAYVLNLRWPSVSVGMFTTLFNLSYLLVQAALLRRDFKAAHLLQVAASVLLGYLIDGWMLLLSGLQPANFGVRLGLTLLGALVTAFGVSLEVAADAWMLPAEMTVSAFAKVLRKPFGPVKVVMDSLTVVLAAVLSGIFFANPFGAGAYTGAADLLLARTPGTVIGSGTLLLAVLPGLLMRLTDPLAGWLRDRSGRNDDTPR